MSGAGTPAGIVTAASLLLAHIGANAAATEQWVRYAEDASGRYSYDPASVRKTGERLRVAVRVEISRPPGVVSETLIAEAEIDCAGQSRAFVAVKEYGPAMELLRSASVPPERIRHAPLVAGSSDDDLYRTLCPNGRPLIPRPAGPPPVATPRR